MISDLKWVSTTNMFVEDGGKVLVVKRGDNEADFPGWYMLPGGKQEVSETPVEAAIRETFEETGIKVSDPKLRVVATHLHEYKSKVYVVYIFTADKFIGDLVQSDEGEAMWLPLNELLEDPKLYPDLRRHIKIIIEDRDQLFFTYHSFNSRLEIVKEA